MAQVLVLCERRGLVLSWFASWAWEVCGLNVLDMLLHEGHGRRFGSCLVTRALWRLGTWRRGYSGGPGGQGTTTLRRFFFGGGDRRGRGVGELVLNNGC